MDITMLLLYVDVCDEASISKAASRNYLSRQGLTSVMNKLEAEVGVPLLIRSSAGVELTDQGRYLYARAQEIIRCWNDAIDDIHSDAFALEPIRMGLSLAMMDESLLVDLIGAQISQGQRYLAFENAEPEECWRLLRERKIDVAYTIDPHDDASLISVPAGCPLDGTYLLMAAESPLSSLSEVTAESLHGQVILFPEDITSSSTRISEYCRRANAAMVSSPAVHGVQKSLVERGYGMAVIPGNALPFFRSPQLVAKPLCDFNRQMKLAVVRRRDAEAEVSAVADRCLAMIRAFLERAAYDVLSDGTIVFPA